MNLELLFDPLFRTPFLVGLIMSAILPLVGNLLRLRDEWLAALGLAYLAGASGLIFHQAEECKRMSGVDPFDPDVVEALIGIIESRGERYGSPDVDSEEEARRRAEGIKLDG